MVQTDEGRKGTLERQQMGQVEARALAGETIRDQTRILTMETGEDRTSNKTYSMSQLKHEFDTLNVQRDDEGTQTSMHHPYVYDMTVARTPQNQT